MTKQKKPHHIRRALLIALTIAAVLVAGCMVYLTSYATADETALSALASQEGVTVSRIDGGILFQPDDPQAGFIFYPGAKVDSAAYAPLMTALARNGVLCIVADMPFHMAIFRTDAADALRTAYPEITRWSIGGHSMGGAMAAQYVASHADDYDGLVLLAAYSTSQLPDAGLSVVAVVGSEDGVLNQAKFEQCKSNLPESTRIVTISGGNHAQFGSYGAQSGDNAATITAEEQTAQTVAAILPTLLGSLE